MFSRVRFCMRFCACAYLILTSVNCYSNVIFETVNPGSFKPIELQIQEKLGQAELLLQYNYFPNTQRVQITLATQEAIEVFTQKVPNDFIAIVETFRELLAQQSLARKSKRLDFIKMSYQLHAILINPVLKYLGHKHHLIVIPDQVIQQIPFDLLLGCEADRPFSELDFLIKQLAISYHFSTQGYLNANIGKNTFDMDMLAFAPVFEDSNILAANNNSPNMEHFRESGTLNALPYSKIEVQNIQSLLRQHKMSKTKTLLHEQATKQKLKDNAQVSVRFIHIASHSFADRNSPSNSGIYCSKDGMASFGILRANEIAKLSIQADLVVLSSCESGASNLDIKKQSEGIHRSFVEAGAAHVVFSNWKVNDKICQEFMLKFYEAILEGQSYASALQTAKLYLMKKPATANPNYWAAFSLTGA